MPAPPWPAWWRSLWLHWGLPGWRSRSRSSASLVLAAGLRAARGFGRWQRALAGRLLGEEIPGPEPVTARPGLFGWLRASFGDWAAWRAVGYFVAKVPITIFGVWFALSVWVEALSGIASLLIGGGAPARFGFFGRFLAPGSSGEGPPAFATRLALFVSGVVLLFVAPWAMRLVVSLDKRMMHLLLSRDAAASRVRSLEESRSKTLDAATETLRRIERDLHDGTQAQLVALAMRLGQAKEKLDHLTVEDRDAEVQAIRRLVDEAHRGVKDAVTDLRDLARGIHPPVLDTGLENALTTLASRSPVPTDVTVSVPTRPSAAIEAICYFCAAELLANVVQHARATPRLAELRSARAVAQDRGARQRSRWRQAQRSRSVIQRPCGPGRSRPSSGRPPEYRQPSGRPEQHNRRPTVPILKWPNPEMARS